MTRLGDKIKVERLDTGRLARIEERVVAAHALPDGDVHERARWLRFAPAAAAACALVLVAGALGYWLRGGSGGGAAGGSAPDPAITTGPGESATVAVGDAIVTIEQNTLVSIRTRPDGRIDLDLARGKVDCDVTPRPGRPVFAVHAADVDVAVVGTAFSVEASGAEVHVTVTRGKVSVTRSGKQIYVAAGEGWPAGTRVAAAETDPDRAPDPDPDRAPDPDPDPDSDPDPGAQLQPQKTGDGAQATGNGQRAASSRKSNVTLPAGLPARHPCGSEDACWDIVRNNYRDDAAAALYTLIRLYLDRKDLDLARKHAELYLRRFPKGKEAAAVKQLRRIAGGD